MWNIQDLDRAFERTRRFVRACRHPGARALAAARLIERLPDRFVGASYYADELGEILAAALESPDLALDDPEIRDRIERARVRCGLPALPPRAADEAREPPGAPRAGGTSGDRRARELRVPIPLVLPLPTLGAAGEDEDEEAIATVAPLRAVPRPSRAREPRIRWVSSERVRDDGRYRPLVEVGTLAWNAAMAAVSAFLGVAPGTRRSDPSFDLGFEDAHVPAAGDSLGLGMAAAIAGCVLGARRNGKGARPRPTLAWTGAVTDAGEVAEVDPLHLRAKVRQAFHSGLDGIVVPAAQAEAARAFVPPDASGREFAVLGIQRVSDALADPRLHEPWRLPRSAYRALVRSRAEGALAVAAGAAILAAAGLAVGAAVRAESYRGPRVVAGEQEHLLRIRYAGGARDRLIAAPGAIEYAAISPALDDGRRRGRRLVVVSTTAGEEPGLLRVFDPVSGRGQWEYRFDRLPVAPRLLAPHPDGTMNPVAAICADLDRDGREEIVVAASVHPYSTCVLTLFDGGREPKGVWVHPGHVEHLAAADLDGDGRNELTGTAINNPCRALALLVLHTEQFVDVERAASPAWDFRTQPCLAYVVIPQPDGLREVNGSEGLGNSGIALIPRPSRPPLVGVDASVDPTEPRHVDYRFTFGFPLRLAAVMINACMRERAYRWIRDGRTAIDFASADFLERWESRIRSHDSAVWDDDAPGRPVPRERQGEVAAPSAFPALGAARP